MSILYLGVRLPEKPFQRVKLDDINFTTKNIFDIKIDAEKILNYSHNNLGEHFYFEYKYLENAYIEQCSLCFYIMTKTFSFSFQN